MKFLVLQFVALFAITNVVSGYLTPTQQQMVKNIIGNHRTPKPIREKVKHVVFLHYLPWIRKECDAFLEKNPALITFTYYNSIHKRTFRAYAQDELYQDMCHGFYKVLNRFNGDCSPLTHYATPYMKQEIYKGITVSTKQRRYKYLLENGKEEKRITPPSIDEGFREIYAIVHDPLILTPIEREMMYYRYNLETLKKIRTIREVCEIMGFSEETYRKYHKKIVEKICAVTRDRGLSYNN